MSQQIQQEIESNKRAPHVFTTRNGTVLKLRHVPSLTILQAQKRLKEPEVPKWYNEAKSREEENPNDPAYLRAVDQYRSDLGDLTTNVYLANGVSVMTLGEDVVELESDDWSEGLKFVGIDIPDSGVARRVAWLRYHVVGDSDLGDLIAAMAIAGGVVTEEAVAAAAESFRNNQNGPDDTKLSIVEPSGDIYPSGDSSRDGDGV